MAHVAESLHWYTRDGGTAYTVKAKDGSDRPATLRDARKLNLVPSVTSIIKCAAAPGLEAWKQNQVMLAAMTLPKRQDEPEAAYIKRIMEDSREHARKAAERGSAIHAAIQGHYEDVPPHEDFWPYVKGATEAVQQWCKGYWTPERSFAHPLGFGGKVDLSCAFAVVDFKTKEFESEDDLKTWDEHAMQLAAYRVGLNNETARCAIGYVSVTTPGLARLIEIPEETLRQGWEMFRSLLQYWQAKTGYQSGWMKEAA